MVIKRIRVHVSDMVHQQLKITAAMRGMTLEALAGEYIGKGLALDARKRTIESGGETLRGAIRE